MLSLLIFTLFIYFGYIFPSTSCGNITSVKTITCSGNSQKNINVEVECVISLTFENNGYGLSECEILAHNLLKVKLDNFIRNVTFICTSTYPISVETLFENESPIVHYTKFRKERKSLNYFDSNKNVYTLRITIPFSPPVLGLSVDTTLVKYRIISLIDQESEVTVLLYALSRCTESLCDNNIVHWMNDKDVIKAKSEILILPCISINGNVSLLRFVNNYGTEVLPVDNITLSYSPDIGFSMNTSLMTRFTGDYLCTVKDTKLYKKVGKDSIKNSKRKVFLVGLALITTVPHLAINTLKKSHLTEPNVKLFSVSLLPDEWFQPMDDHYNRYIEFSSVIDFWKFLDVTFRMICSSRNANVTIFHKPRQELYIKIKSNISQNHYEVSKPEKRFYSEMNVTYLSWAPIFLNDDRYKGSGENIEAFECKDSDGFILNSWQLQISNYSNDVPLTMMYLAEEKKFMCFSPAKLLRAGAGDKILFHQLDCENSIQCKILAKCLKPVFEPNEDDDNEEDEPKKMKTDSCIKSIVNAKGSSCQEADYKTFVELFPNRPSFSNPTVCEILNALKSGMVFCATSDFVLQKTYFKGFDGNIYTEADDPPLHAIIKMKGLSNEEYIYKLGDFPFYCEAHSFYFEEGLHWLVQFANGTVKSLNTLTSSFRKKNQTDFVNANGNPSSSVIIQIFDSEIEKITCAAPVWNTAFAWKNKSVDIEVKESYASKITSEEDIKIITIGETGQGISCETSGYPFPKITWTRDGKEVTSIKGIKVVEEVMYKLIRFIRYDKQYEGIYKCFAENIAGNDTKHFTVKTFVDHEKTTRVLLYTLPASLLLVLLVSSLSLAYVYIRKIKRERDKEMNELLALLNRKKEGDDDPPISNYDEENPLFLPYNEIYEIEKFSFFINKRKLLGEGEYGQVFKGRLEGVDRDVAFKTVKANCPFIHLKALVSELKILMFIGKHSNVVQLYGAYTKEIRDRILFIATEFCSLGSLEGYLQSNRHIFVSNFEKMQANVNDQEARMDWDYLSDFHALHSLPSLFKWSAEIATAMEYLGFKKIIHSDLATRNVLLTADAMVKITDFGLSKQTYKYVRRGEDRVPWQWLALECLKTNTYSIKSDVWAYGITLWEMFSLGNVPYPGISYTLDFVDCLEKGFRNKKPNYASSEIYSLMQKCWSVDPNERPMFTEMKILFENALRNKCLTIEFYSCIKDKNRSTTEENSESSHQCETGGAIMSLIKETGTDYVIVEPEATEDNKITANSINANEEDFELQPIGMQYVESNFAFL